MEKERLTAFDKFILEQKEQNDLKPDKNVVEQEMPDSYRLYLEQQLRRVEPSDTKVLTMDEFLGGSVIAPQKGNEHVFSDKNDEEKPHSILRNIKFKKSGKILLGVYVIIMLALALIVIVKTTTGGPDASADAADTVMTEDDKPHIEKMVAEKSEESDDWFDRFCDSLKK